MLFDRLTDEHHYLVSVANSAVGTRDARIFVDLYRFPAVHYIRLKSQLQENLSHRSVPGLEKNLDILQKASSELVHSVLPMHKSLSYNRTQRTIYIYPLTFFAASFTSHSAVVHYLLLRCSLCRGWVHADGRSYRTTFLVIV